MEKEHLHTTIILLNIIIPLSLHQVRSYTYSIVQLATSQFWI